MWSFWGHLALSALYFTFRSFRVSGPHFLKIVASNNPSNDPILCSQYLVIGIVVPRKHASVRIREFSRWNCRMHPPISAVRERSDCTMQVPCPY